MCVQNPLRCRINYNVSPSSTGTSLFRGHHQGLGGLAPALPGLSGKAEHVHQLWLQPRGRVLSRAGAEHVDGGGVDV